MVAVWILTAVVCSFVCEARLIIHSNKTVPLIGYRVPMTWDEVHILAPNINGDNDVSTLAAVLQKSFVAVSLTSASNMSGACRINRTKFISWLQSVGPRTDFDYGPPIFWHCLSVFVPGPQELPPWMQLASTFTLELWLVICATYVFFVLAWYTLGRCSSSAPPSLLRCASHGVFVLVAMEWPRSLQDASRGTPQRGMLAGLMLLSLVLITAFQSCLVDILQSPRKSKPIDTLDDLRNSDLPIYTTMDITYLAESTFLADWKERMRPSTGPDVFKDIGNGAQHAVIELELSLPIYNAIYSHGKGHICKEKILCTYSSFNQPFRSPWSEAIKLAYLKLSQALLHIQIKHFRRYGRLPIEKQGPKKLTLNDVKPAFLILLVCLAGSFSVFLFECREQIKLHIKLAFSFCICCERRETI